MENIKQKLEQLKKADQKFGIFGSDRHQYITNPVLSEDQVRMFEEKHALRLPEDYRSFLTNIGNGGAGPFYGLYELENNGDQSPDLSRPFSLGVHDRLKLMDVYDEIDARMEEEDIEDDDEEDELRDRFYEEICDGIDCGIIPLATEGCGMDSVLVVKGEAYGTVWYYDLANDAGVFPLTSPYTGEPMTFAEWYGIWLDKSLSAMDGNKDALQGYGDFIAEEEDDTEDEE